MAAVEEFLEAIPLYPDQTEAVIRARWDAWANEGVTVDQVDEWTDTRQGAFFYITTQPGVREAARMYDLMGTEVPMASNPLWAWETYLDDHAAVQDLDRLPATFAEGVVTFSGPNGTVIPAGFTVGVTPSTDTEDAPEYQTQADVTIAAGTVNVAVVATEPGVKGNVGAGAVTAFSTPPPDGVTVTNAAAITGGTETQTDEGLRTRLLDRYIGQGSGNQADYRRWTLDEPGVGRVSVISLWNGPGTVKVIPMTPEGGPVAAGVVASLQTRLDPVAGQGEGQAPVGATVTVQTATGLNVAVVADVTYESGYSVDGFGGTIAVGDLIRAAVESYVEGVGPGEEVVLTQVIGRIVSVIGVHDVAGVTLNGSAANISVPASPTPQVPIITTITLT